MHLTCPNQHGRTPAGSTVKADTSILKALTVRVKECGTNNSPACMLTPYVCTLSSVVLGRSKEMCGKKCSWQILHIVIALELKSRNLPPGSFFKRTASQTLASGIRTLINAVIACAALQEGLNFVAVKPRGLNIGSGDVPRSMTVDHFLCSIVLI